MSGDNLLRIADSSDTQKLPHASANPSTRSLLDLSIRDGQSEPDSTEWRARVVVPLAKPENLSLLGLKVAVRSNLQGRLPDTYWNKVYERFVVTFAIPDTSESSLAEAGAFALRLAEVLEPMTTEVPFQLHLEHHGQAIKEIPSAQ